MASQRQARVGTSATSSSRATPTAEPIDYVVVEQQERNKTILGQRVAVKLYDTLSSLLPKTLPAYQWFAPANQDAAIECFLTIRQAVRSNDLARAKLFVGALVDVYQQDRAEHACSLVPDIPTPVREIPRTIWLGSDAYTLTDVSPVTEWVVGVPKDRVSAIARIERLIHPDEYKLAKYYRNVPRDPILFARFGGWHVALAQWD